MSATSPEFRYDILGYIGYAKFNEYPILATDGSFQVTHNMMFTTGLYGGKINNATSHIAAAPDYPSISANIGFQLTTKDNFFSQLGNSISSNSRYKWNQVTVYPNGCSGYRSNMYTQSLQYSTSQDSLVTGSVAFKGADINSVTKENISQFYKYGIGGSDNSYLNDLAPNYTDVFPYCGTQWQFQSAVYGITSSSNLSSSTSSFSHDIISWSITTSQQVNFVKLCNCQVLQLSQMKADFAVLGMIQVSGNAQLVGINQRLESGNMFYYSKGENTLLMKSANEIKQRKITFYNMQITDVSSSLQNGNGLVTTSFNFVVFGNNNSNPIIKYLQS